jgi:hypothetical protein
MNLRALIWNISPWTNSAGFQARGTCQKDPTGTASGRHLCSYLCTLSPSSPRVRSEFGDEAVVTSVGSISGSIYHLISTTPNFWQNDRGTTPSSSVSC